MLSQEQVDQFNRDGFLVIKDFSSEEKCAEMKSAIAEVITGFDFEHKSVFSTDEQKRKHGDMHFLTSGDKVRYFLEEKALDENGDFTCPKEEAINKIGHALHIEVPVFRRWTMSLRGLAKSVGFRKPSLLQGMYIFKQPRIGGAVGSHQDSTFLYTNPQSCVGFWMPLDDATLENGCLWAIPGSHKDPQYEQVSSRFVRNKDETGTEFRPAPTSLPTEGGVAVPMSKGSLMLIHGSLIHFSAKNTSDKPRHAFTVHAIETDNTDYPRDNWLQNENHEPFATFDDLERADRES